MKYAILALLACFLAVTLAQTSGGRCAYCTGQTCGPNGIGGSCGSCPSGQRCYRGTCICDRGCTGFECGPDRCGTSCGDCLPGQTCISGKCTGACTPQCVRSDGTVRTCGWDRCGGCCGSCPVGYRCRDGTCECYPSCENRHCGDDGCGGTCGTCQGGAICQGNNEPYPGQCYFNCAIPIRVEECLSHDAVATATITVGGQTINYQGSATFTPTSGFTTYTFSTSSPNYLSNTQSVNIVSSTNLITLCVNLRPINFVVTSCVTGATINGATVEATSNVYTSYNFTFTYFSSGTTWTPVGYQGSYTFRASAPQYLSTTSVQTVSLSTTTITVCLSESAFCGDGVCSGAETAIPSSASRCYDCGRLRGVISLAVGQKDQLVNITISVWPDPINPATYLRQGQPVPTPAFTTLSDTKGFFSINTLNFDAGVNNRAEGQAKRRFYFSLTGQFTDRTTGVDVVTTLLPLWWNYELTNRQWSGSGALTNTNNSPSFYFYMTPPFTTDDALIRVILSWGTQISNPSNSLPDADLVVAGPVDQSSIALYGNGVVNFENKDLHASTKNLPYCKLVTDSAQGFGPEVMDFYGVPGQLALGFSSSYSPGAPANAYEIWVDRPNSSPNQDSIAVTISDTNAFIVVYQNDGTSGGNKQVLFDARTGVPYAYGFYNTDQWNMVPLQATMWHIIDLSQAAGGVVYNGFPGENNTQDHSATPGAKYAYSGGSFDITKAMPCGHVAARGANPSYCPATLTYPQSKKK